LLPGRRKLAVAAQLALAAVVVWFAAQTISRQWEGVRATALDVEPRWSLIGASGVIVLATYALLIQIWRATLSVWGARLGFWDAARVWTVSNLGKYVPGKVWQIGAMGAMAQRRGVPPVAAVGSALVLTLVNVLAGFGVVFATGARVWEAAGASSSTVRAGAFAASALGLLVIAAPALLPRVALAQESTPGTRAALVEQAQVDKSNALHPFEPGTVERVLGRVEGRYEREGSGAAVLGDPRVALAWLANELRALGITLSRGQTVTTGTCFKPLELEPGDVVVADLGVIGRASVRFA